MLNETFKPGQILIVVDGSCFFAIRSGNFVHRILCRLKILKVLNRRPKGEVSPNRHEFDEVFISDEN